MDASVNDALPAAVVLTPGQLYTVQGRQPRLLRFICCDVPTDRALFKQVARKWNPMARHATTMGLLEALRLVKADRLRPEAECIRPRFMTFSEEELRSVDPDWVDEGDRDFAKIAGLMSEESIFSTYCPDTSSRVLAEHAKKLNDGTSVQQLRRLIHVHSWFGLGRNAMLKRHSLKGVGARVARHQGKKRGRPNAAIREGYPARFSGRNVTARDLKLFERALREFWIRGDETLEETYRLMRDTYYVQVTKAADGSKQTHPVSLLKVPTREEFFKHADALRRSLGLDRLKAGHADGMALARNKGSQPTSLRTSVTYTTPTAHPSTGSSSRTS